MGTVGYYSNYTVLCIHNFHTHVISVTGLLNNIFDYNMYRHGFAYNRNLLVCLRCFRRWQFVMIQSTNTCVCVCMCMCMHVCLLCLYTYVYVCMSVCVHACMCAWQVTDQTCIKPVSIPVPNHSLLMTV